MAAKSAKNKKNAANYKSNNPVQNPGQNRATLQSTPPNPLANPTHGNQNAAAPDKRGAS